MVYWDEPSGTPRRHLRIPYDPWSGPFKPTPPPDDAARQLIRRVLAEYRDRSGWGPDRVRAHIYNKCGRMNITRAMIRTVRAEEN